MDKLEHFILLVPICVAAGVLLLGYRDRARVDLPDQLAALLVMFGGALLAVLVELVEFMSDWLLGTQLQPSNTDTMTDLLASALGAIVGAVLATTLYCRWLTARQRERVGVLGQWVSNGPSRMLDRHGLAITLVVAGAVAVAIGLLWIVGRSVAGFEIG